MTLVSNRSEQTAISELCFLLTVSINYETKFHHKEMYFICNKYTMSRFLYLTENYRFSSVDRYSYSCMPSFMHRTCVSNDSSDLLYFFYFFYDWVEMQEVKHFFLNHHAVCARPEEKVFSSVPPI